MLFVSSLPPDVVKEKISQALAKIHADHVLVLKFSIEIHLPKAVIIHA